MSHDGIVDPRSIDKEWHIFEDVILNQDPNGNVYVETVAPKGNAARTGQVGYQEFNL